MKFSVIIPAYNVDQYLAHCLDSLLCQDIDLEIILINDESTDETGVIAERYKSKNKNIHIIHQTHSGPSVARNKGLEIAKGEYIAFIDSDDWITKGILNQLYVIAVISQADMVMGNNTFHYPDGSEKNLFSIPSHLKNRTYTGKQCFISLMEAHVYYPMVWTYIYKHEWIKKHNLRFETGIIHEDEVWTPIALCLADCVVLTDLDYYHYRKREGSIMHTLKRKNRLQALFRVIERLVSFVSGYEDTEENHVLKSWMYVNIYRIMRTAYNTISMLNDSTFIIPTPDAIDIYDQAQDIMPLKAKERCEEYYLMAKAGEKEYLRWKNNPWDIHISQLPEQELQNKRIILIYNTPEWYAHELSVIEKFPSNYVITLDRKCMDQAYATVFHLPDLLAHLDDDLEKQENQIWVAWSSEENVPWTEDEDIGSLFDIRMTYQETSDVVYSFYTGLKKEEIQGTNPFIRLCEVLNKCEL